MRRWKEIGRKGISCVLTACLVAGVFPGMPGAVLETRAAGMTPSRMAYASKADLVKGFKMDKSVAEVGKVVFGKDYNNSDQTWYVLGSDKGGVNAEDTVLVATEPMGEDEVAFQTSTGSDTMSYDVNSGCNYPEGLIPVTVGKNHYGMSILRETLNEMAVNTSYFSQAEQSMMKKTVIEIQDIYNTSYDSIVYYTVEDILYPLSGYEYGVCVYAGSQNDKVVKASEYYGESGGCWTRTPSGAYGGNNYLLSSMSRPGDMFNYEALGSTMYSVQKNFQPAFDLNLENVLFSSSVYITDDMYGEVGEEGEGHAPADTENGEVQELDGSDGATVEFEVYDSDDLYYYPMYLRLNGENSIESVLYMKNNGEIVVEPAAGESVRLMIQGKGNNYSNSDWCFSDLVIGEGITVEGNDPTGTISVTEESVEDGSNGYLLQAPDFANCKIWIEKTGDDGLIYAKQLKTQIASVSMGDIEAPANNIGLDAEVTCNAEGVKTVSPISWTLTDTEYKATVLLTPEEGYMFNENTTVAIGSSGENVNVTLNNDGTLTVTKSFDKPAKPKVSNIGKPEGVVYAEHGVAKTPEALGLPEKVSVSVEGNAFNEVDVTWDLVNLASGSYDPAALTEQTFVVNGTVTIPDGYELDNSVSDIIQCYITVKGAETVQKPEVSMETGKQIKITLSTSTPNAEIYYTTDGTTPSRINGIKYTEAIVLPETQGQSVTTTIKAIAVGQNMQDSDVQTYVCVSDLPKPKLLSISTPSKVTGVKNGAAKTVEALGLSSSVPVVVEDETATEATVTWDLENLVKGSYDPKVLTEQTFMVKGTVAIPGQYDLNEISTTVQVEVTVSEAERVMMPTVNTFFDKVKKVSLFTSTKDAEIYYTLDGSIPSKTNGKKYTEAFEIPGVTGQSVTTVIKAVAVKENMQNSLVQTFEYVNKVSKPKLLMIVNPADIQGVKNGTKKTVKDLGLPEKVTVAVEDGLITEAEVTWDLEALAEGSYDPTVSAKQMFTVKGSVAIPETYDLGDMEAKAFVNVIVEAKEIKVTLTPEVTATVTPIPEVTATVAPTSGVTATVTPTSGVTAAVTQTPEVTATVTPTPEMTVTVMPTLGVTTPSIPTVKVTATPTPVPTKMPTVAPTMLQKKADKPKADLKVGTYTENKNITLSTDTKYAEIYYTLDGSIPTKENGIKYTKPIQVTGVAGKSVTTTIKAVTVRNGMEDSEVETFTYVISIPATEHKNEVGFIIKYGDAKYRIVSRGTVDAKTGKVVNATVEYLEPLQKTIQKADTLDEITVYGITYKVVRIAHNAFKNCTELTTITMGNNITKIGIRAFEGCTKLQNVAMGKNVAVIETKAFHKCSALEKITIPASVKKIGVSTFAECKKLKTVSMGKNVESIGSKAFYNCVALEKITIPEKAEKIANATFYGCKKLKSVKIGKNVTSIGNKAFYKCTSLQKVTIPSKVKKIGSRAFMGCKNMKSVKLGTNVTTIGSRAFYNCTLLQKVTIPAKVKKIEKECFYGCKKLKSITIKTKKLTSKTVGSKAFGKTYAKVKVTVPKAKANSYKKFLYGKGISKKATIK